MKMNTSTFRKAVKKKERGVALIFTLGILGLLTVMALGFASTAMMNRKISYNSTQLKSANSLARLGAQRALFALSQLPQLSAEQIFSKDNGSRSTSDSVKSCDRITALATKINGNTIYDLPLEYDPATDVSWQYVRDSEEPYVLRGRYAYVVLPCYGRLNPAVHDGSGSRDNVTDPHAINMESDLAKQVETIFKRSGVVLKLNSDARNVSNSRRFFDMGDFFKSVSLTGSTKIAKLTSLEERYPVEYLLKRSIGIPSQSYPEAYWMDYNNSNQRNSANYFPRFDLQAFVNECAAADTLDKAKDLVEKLTPSGNTEIKTFAKSESADLIPWIANWNGTNGDDWDSKKMAKQIAANIVQYNRSDNVNYANVHDGASATAIDPAADTASEPSYMGLGRNPYINEVGATMLISASITETPNADNTEWTYSCTYNVSARFGTELIDMFYIKNKHDMQLDIYGSYSFRYRDVTVDAPENGSDKEDDKRYWKTWAVAEPVDDAIPLVHLVKRTIFVSDWESMIGYTKANSFWAESADSQVSPATSPTVERKFDHQLTDQEKAYWFRIKDITLHVRSVILREPFSSTLPVAERDFSKVQELPTPLANPVEEVRNLGDTDFVVGYDFAGKSVRVFNVAWQVQDPRVNHYPSDWALSSNTKIDASASLGTDYDVEGMGSPGRKNRNVSTLASGSSTQDSENHDDPAFKVDGTSVKRLSSAYIRCGEMESMAELGMIHRAGPFQTLNFKRAKYFEGTANTVDKIGGGTYADGDGNMLDQIKWGGETSSYGKININTDSHEVLERLFNGITFLEFKSISEGKAALNKLEDWCEAKKDGDGSILTTYILPRWNGLKDKAIGEEATHATDSCLACAILLRRAGFDFKSRSDLLLRYPSAFTSDNQKWIREIPGTTFETVAPYIQDKSLLLSGPYSTLGGTRTVPNTDLEEEQLIFKVINLIEAEPIEYYIISVGQTIKDVGGTTLYKHYTEKEKEALPASITNLTAPNYKLWRRLGYVRPIQENDYVVSENDGSPKKVTVKAKQIISSLPTLTESVPTEFGKYDWTADLIESQSKLVMVVRKDPYSHTWKVVRYFNAD